MKTSWDKIVIPKSSSHSNHVSAGVTSSNNNTAHIMLMFYQPEKNDPWMNKVVAWLDKPFSHVEIGFHDGYASSIFDGETVFYRQRTFSNPQYTMQAIAVSEEQLRLLRMFCMEASKKNIKFDRIGMYSVHLGSVMLPPRLFRACKRIMSKFVMKKHSTQPLLETSCSETSSSAETLLKTSSQNKYRTALDKSAAALLSTMPNRSTRHKYEPISMHSINNVHMQNFCIEETDDVNTNNGIPGAALLSLHQVLDELHRDGTFCSKYVVKALQYAGVCGFELMNSNKTSPSNLYHHIKNAAFQNQLGGLIVAANPYRQHLLEQCAKIA